MIDDRRKPSAPPPPLAPTADGDETVQILAGDAAAAAARRRASRRLRVPNDLVPRRGDQPGASTDGREGDAGEARLTDPAPQPAVSRSIVPPPPDDLAVLQEALKSLRPGPALTPQAVSSPARVSLRPQSVPPPPVASATSSSPPIDENGVVRQVRRKIRSVGTGEAPSMVPARDSVRADRRPASVPAPPAEPASIPVPAVPTDGATGDDFDVPPVVSEPAAVPDASAESESVDVAVDDGGPVTDELIEDAVVEESAEDIAEPVVLRAAVADAPAVRPPPPPTAKPAADGAKAASAETARDTSKDSRPTIKDEAPKRKRRAWWEELFNDDYFRTMPRYSTEQITTEGDFIEASLGVEKGAVVLDVACGTGRQAIELAARGYEVIALDLSLPMLSRAADAAQDRGAKLNFLHSDMREMEFFEMFDAAYCMNTAFGYFEDDKNVDVARRLHTALKPGGTLLLDVLNRDFAVQNQPSMAWYEGDGCVCMEETNFNYISSRLVVKRTMIFDDGRQRELEYSIRLYSLHELGKLLHQTGFRIVEVSGHPKTPGAFFGPASKSVIILAQKQASPEPAAAGAPGAQSRPTTPDVAS